jgi:hypothetical protein
MQIINVSFPNDGLGDYLRTGFVKVNANFQEVLTLLAAKAPLASPVFTGTPQAPTAAVGTNTTQIATTAFVKGAVAGGNYWTGGTGVNSVVQKNNSNTATGNGAIAVNNGNAASGAYSFAQGFSTKAVGSYSVSIGANTEANQSYTFAGGFQSKANGVNSFAFGNKSWAVGQNTVVFGDSITGNTADTMYVDRLNIKNVSTGTAIKNLGVDSTGKVVGSSLDTFVTGGTHTLSTGITQFKNNTGGTFNVTGYYTGYTAPLDIRVTGGTHNFSAGTSTFKNNTGGTFSVTGYSSLKNSSVINNLPRTIDVNGNLADSIVNQYNVSGEDKLIVGVYYPLSGIVSNDFSTTMLPMYGGSWVFDPPNGTSSSGEIYSPPIHFGQFTEILVNIPMGGNYDISFAWKVDGVGPARSFPPGENPSRLNYVSVYNNGVQKGPTKPIGDLYNNDIWSAYTATLTNLTAGTVRQPSDITNDLTAKNIVAQKFIKSGGTSNQYLMADGSISLAIAPVSSVFGRTGAVVAVSGDYSTTLVPDTVNKRYQTDTQKTNNDATSPIQAQIDSKQPNLVSGTNIKTVGGQSIVGSGNVTEVANDLTASTTIAPSKTAVNTALGGKQDNLVSGTNIKTVGNQSIVGTGNVTEVQNNLTASAVLAPSVNSVNTALSAKQDILTSGTNVKTIEGNSILGSGDINLIDNDLNPSTVLAPTKTAVNTALATKQNTLVSGTNIKTVGGQSIVGSGDVTEVQNSLVASTILAPSVSSVNTALALKENTANKNAASGYAGLDSSGKINPSQLPAIAITDTFVVASQAAMLALAAETGDIAVRTDLSKTFILKGAVASVLANWQELITPTDSVSSVFGRTGVVTAQAGDYDTSLVADTTNKRYQTDAQNTRNDATSSIQTQLNGKQFTLTSGLTIKTVGGISLLGSGNVTEVQNSMVASTTLAPSVTAVNTLVASMAIDGGTW